MSAMMSISRNLQEKGRQCSVIDLVNSSAENQIRWATSQYGTQKYAERVLSRLKLLLKDTLRLIVEFPTGNKSTHWL